jgi:hypothetical protein
MSKKVFIPACIVTVIALLLNFQLVLAHESVTVGDYELVVGWVNEPPVAGQLNAIVVEVSHAGEGEDHAHEPVEDVSSLTIAVSYGGQEKTLTLQPLGEDAPGQYIAPILPTVPGQYTVTFGGQLGDTDVDAHVEPEEVAAADTIQFPSADSAEQNVSAGSADWLVWLSLLIGLVGVGLGVTALRKK